MDDYEKSIKSNFENMHTEMLIARKLDGGMTDAAEKILDAELKKRNVTSVEISEYSNDAGYKELLKKELPNGLSENDLASAPQRLVAQIVDQFIAVFLAIVISLIFSTLGFKTLSIIVTIVIYIAYVTLNDALPNGQSYGKHLMKIKVIDLTSGTDCNLGQAFTRNITTAIPLISLIDGLMIFSRKRQRMGDRLANTIVIRARK